MAEIIQLKTYQTAVRGINGVKFPQLYRIRGFYHESEEPSPMMYSLDNTTTGGFDRVTYEPIKGFDPVVDSGWLFVRHHMTEQLAEGYFDAVYDKCTGQEDLQLPHYLFKTETGIFSLQQREPTPGAPDHLVVYITKASSQNPVVAKYGNGWVDEYQIILPDGSSTSDTNILYDPENADW